MEINWAAVAAIMSVLTLLTVVIGIAVGWGKMTERVDNLSLEVDGNRVNVEKHAITLTDHAVAIGKLEQWKDGFNAAAKVSGQTQRA